VAGALGVAADLVVVAGEADTWTIGSYTVSPITSSV
jgi:hypothetical protein